MKVRSLKRIVCFILAFLMLTGSVGPVPVLPTAWASASADAQEETVPSTEPESTPSSEQKEKEKEAGPPSEQKEEKAESSSEQKKEEEKAESSSEQKKEEEKAESSSEQKEEEKAESSSEQKEEEKESEPANDKTDGENKAEKAESLRVIYFQPNKTWTEGSSRFAAAVTTATGESWIDGTDEEKDGRLEFQFPADVTTFCFVRLDADQTDNEWEYARNQTEELTVPDDETLDLFTLDEDNDKEKDKESGTWTNAAKTPLPQEENAEKNGQKALAMRGATSTAQVSGVAVLYGTVAYENSPFNVLLRPQTFDQTLAVVPLYRDATGELRGPVEWATSLDPSGREPCSLSLVFPGDGTAEFEIKNVPRTVTVTEAGGDKEYIVAYYRVIAKDSNPSNPSCYEQTDFVPATTVEDLSNTESGKVTASGLNVKLDLKTCTMTLDTQVEPDDGMGTVFLWKIKYTRPDSLVIDAEKDAYEATESIVANKQSNIKVPVGINYEIDKTTAQNAEGYRLVGIEPASGTTAEGTTVTVKYAPINLNLRFLVDWIDNNSVARPTDYENIFTLMVRKKTGQGEPEDQWVQFPFKLKKTTNGVDQWVYSPANPDLSALQATYGVDNPSELSVNGNNYVFSGLPGADKEGNQLEYQVVCNAPDNYQDSYDVATKTFTLRHCHSFTASIEWKDDGNKERLRPADGAALSNLSLYSRTIDENGSRVLTEITGDRGTWQWNCSETENTWNLTVPNLPTYTDDNHEIEYFLVHGTDTLVTETVDGKEIQTERVNSSNILVSGMVYNPYYHNGTGSYASDEERCHDNGKITMLLGSNTDFFANVVWRDDNEADTISKRPAATLTLWRFVNDGTTQNSGSLDGAFQNEMASMVVYLDGADEKPLSFTVPAGSTSARLVTKKDSDTGKDQVICYYKTDDNGTEHSLDPITLTLPGHDGHGQRYTYFLRETLTGNHKDNYRVTYADYAGINDPSQDSGLHAEGVPHGGTVINTRQEKALVTVVKTWRNPDGLELIDGATVQLKLYAKKQNATDADSEELLQVYEAKEGSYEFLTGNDLIAAQTAQGFKTTIPTAQKSYYVNIYNSKGLLYDMANACLEETVTLNGAAAGTDQVGKTITLTDSQNNSQTYEVLTTYVSSRSDTTSDPKRFHYEQLNTITSKRSYNLIKEWRLNNPQSQPYKNNIESVEMQLYRCKLKDLKTANANREPLGTRYIDWNNTNSWSKTLSELPAYDNQGNVYYYFAEETGFILREPSGKKPEGAQTETRTIDNVTKTFVPFSAYKTIGWGNSYTRSDESTTVYNYDAPGSGYFVISKNWKDNNDKDRPDSVTVRIYKRDDLYTCIQSQNDDALLDWTLIDTAAITPVDKDGNPASTADIVLRESSNYTVEQTFKSLCNNDETTAQSARINDYVVLEYKVGSGAQTASYTYGEIAKLCAVPSNQSTDATSAVGKADYTGTDSSKNRSYNVTVTRDPGFRTYYILNERTGTTSLHLTKTWNDEDNRDGLRPTEVSFQIYRDGELYTDLKHVTFDATTKKNGNSHHHDVIVEKKSDSNGYTGTFAVKYTGTNTKDDATEWDIKVDNLPMFEGETGMLYAYTIDETNSSVNAASTDSIGSVHYIKSRGAVDSSVTGNTQTFDISLLNTVAGTRTHTAYKYWKDISVQDKSMRPELILTLYRYIGSEYSKVRDAAAGTTTLPEYPTYDELNELTQQQKNAIDFIKVTNHNDPVLTPGDKTAKGASGQAYDWKIDISDLPRFDDSGREYVYVLREQMTNEGKTVLGTYQGSTVRTPIREVNADNTVTIKEYDEFTNVITGELSLGGVKTWKGHQNYKLTMDDLPDPTITLYRTTNDTLSSLSDLSNKTDLQINEYLRNHQIVKVDEIHLSGNNKSRYSFPSEAKKQEYANNGNAGAGESGSSGDGPAVDGTGSGSGSGNSGTGSGSGSGNSGTGSGSGSGNASSGDDAEPLFVYDGSTLMLPKYDKNGKRYVYLMRETLPGQIVEALYSKTSVTGTLVNTLNPGLNRRQITVYKKWDRTDDKDNHTEYHSMTFKLWRYLQNSGADKAELYQSQTISPKNLKAYYQAHPNDDYPVEFKDLLVYSPAGEPYGYYVTEVAIDGYESIISRESDYDHSENASAPGNLLITDTEGWKSPTPIQNNLYAKNTYKPSEHQIRLKGSKIWDDWKNEAQIRPQNIVVTLTRSTHEEHHEGTGQENPIDSREVALDVLSENDSTDNRKNPWIQWRTTGDTDSWGRDKWTYEIGGLPRYAPNGMPYIYTLTEKLENTDYQAPGSAGSVSTGDRTPDQTDQHIDLDNLTNSLTMNYSFVKYWVDGSDLYNLRPKTITVVMQYSVDGGITWQDMEYKDVYELKDSANGNIRVGASKKWIPFTDKKTQHVHENALAAELSASENVLSGTGGNTWKFTFQNLPAKRKVDDQTNPVPVKYRCIEVKVGNVELEYSGNYLTGKNEDLTDSTGFVVAAYKATYRKIDDNSTFVQNSLNSTSLKVTKKWVGDQNDLYQTRPKELLFRLERKGNEIDNTTHSLYDWDVVKVAGREDGYFTLTPDENGKWERTLEDLPISGTDEQGVDFFQMQYRAVEVHDPDTDNTVKGAKNYVDQNDYNDDAKDGLTFDSTNTDAQNASTITNHLTCLNASISAEKVWYSSDNRDDSSVKAEFELQYRTHSAQDGSVSEWTSYAPALTQTVTKKSNGVAETVTWSNLPKYDREGNALEYRIIEHTPSGYVSVTTADAGAGSGGSSGDGGDLEGTTGSTGTGSSDGTGTYKFVNVELQSYTVHKTWQKDENGTDYIPSDNKTFTSTFILEQKIGSNTWAPVPGAPEKTLTGNHEDSWDNLPKFTSDGTQIIYRAVETKINGHTVDGNLYVDDVNGYSDGNYIATYLYDSGSASPAFCGTQTNSTNRLVYGFVNLSKGAAYLDPNDTPIVQDTNVNLSGIEFRILDARGTPYATEIFTDGNGNLINTDGKYGKEKRYLVPGTYTLEEVDTHNSALSRWNSGVRFTVGLNGTNDTGEHGTAWISTGTTGNQLSLTVNYVAPTATSHSFGAPDTCAPATGSADAFNLESRGVIEFTKTGPTKEYSTVTPLDTHSGSNGESKAYFGVYTDKDCTASKQVAGMKANPADTTSTKFVLTDEKQDGTKTFTAATTGGILRKHGSGFTLLSGTYYVKELVPPAGYKLDTTVRTVTIDKLDTTTMGSILSSVYSNNKGKFADGNTADYQWPNTPNCVKLYKLDQFGRHVTLKPGGYLELKFDGTGSKFPTGEDTISLYQDPNKPATNADGTTRVGNESDKWSITYETEVVNGKERGYWTITGLFDANKSYTLSEHTDAVPDDNILAKPITFTINEYGQMTAVSDNGTHTLEKITDPTIGRGLEDDYKNYYQSCEPTNPGISINNVVLRDVARFRKNVALNKINVKTKANIPNISFNLYHVRKEDGVAELVTNPPLTTDANGIIDLSKCDISLINQVTGAPLQNGLDLGSYFFREAEMGASDGYRLAEDIHFSIKAVTPDNPDAPYEDYAKLEFDPNSAVTQSGDCGTVTNTPVSGKSLELTKQDKDDNRLLPGAKFKLEYVSVNDGQTGAKTSTVTIYTTDAKGRLMDSSGNAPDISAKGTYTLTEIQASALHSTFTTSTADAGAGQGSAKGDGPNLDSETADAGAGQGSAKGDGPNLDNSGSDPASGTTASPVPAMLQFTVNSKNEITHVSGKSSYILDAFTGTGLVTAHTENSGVYGDLTVSVKNEKTALTIDKRNDLFNSIKSRNQKTLTGEPLPGAVLKIYDGVGTTGTLMSTLKPSTTDAGAGQGTGSGNGPNLDGSGSTGSSGSSSDSSWTRNGVVSKDTDTSWTLTGALSEGNIYTLHEESAPVGYMRADDIYFCLFGTRASDVGSGTESQLYVWTDRSTTPTTAVNGLSTPDSRWSKVENLDEDNDLTMVDEAIIAPVDARKVLDAGENASPRYTPLAGAEFDVCVNGGAKLGTVVSGADGYLTWKSLENAALNGLVYSRQDKRITNASEAEGGPVILQQNAEGYTFQETYAPDQAYNEGVGLNKVYHVRITDQNYIDYKDHPDYVIDLVEAEGNTTDHTAALAAKRSTCTAADLVNPAYHSTVTLHKYDSDPEANKDAIPGTTFKLYRGNTVSEDKVYTKAKDASGTEQTSGEFITDAGGNLSITIPEKGTYTLTETAAATGYKLGSNTFTFTLVDKSDDGKFDYNHSTVLEKDSNGVPNQRQYGTITLTKKDANSDELLNGVEYTLARTAHSGAPDFDTASKTVITGHSYSARYDSTNKQWKLTEDSGSGTSGKITISGLDWGTYTLTESKELSRYKLDSTPWTFTIGATHLDDTNAATNKKNQVTFRKTDNGAIPKSLSGAVFEVHNASGTAVSFYTNPSHTQAQTVTQVTAGSNGEVTIYGLPTNRSSANDTTTYFLKEVEAPEGYVLNPNNVEFTIDRAGTVKWKNDNTWSTGNPTMVDKPIKVTLEKYGEDGSTALVGAEYDLTPESGSRFVTGITDTTIHLASATGINTLEIPTRTLIGGHSYVLKETKAPDGYEATAVIHFTVKEDGSINNTTTAATAGTVTLTNTTGGYRVSNSCAEAVNTKQDGTTEEYESTLKIRDEKIRVTLTKKGVGSGATESLNGVTYKLTPYGEGSRFATITPTPAGLSGNVYSATTGTISGETGVITIPDGLLVHSCKYLLQEQNSTVLTNQRYYLGKEAQDGVILNVDADGKITTVGRLSDYDGKTVNGESSCPVTADNTAGTVALTAKNPKAAAFEFTKDVSGNMGDVTGSFEITLEVYEPDGVTPINTTSNTRVITLQRGEKYNSENGILYATGTVKDASSAFGSNAIPVGAVLLIEENPDWGYEPLIGNVLQFSAVDGATVIKTESGKVWVKLKKDVSEMPTITFTLTNNKDVAIDVGVALEENAPYALITLLIPAVWLYLRARRKRRDGDVE